MKHHLFLPWEDLGQLLPCKYQQLRLSWGWWEIGEVQERTIDKQVSYLCRVTIVLFWHLHAYSPRKFQNTVKQHAVQLLRCLCYRQEAQHLHMAGEGEKACRKQHGALSHHASHCLLLQHKL